MLKIMLKYIRTLFLNGLFTILPFIITISLLTISLRVILNWLEPINDWITPQIPFLNAIPHAEIIITVAFIFFIGFIYNMVVLRPIIHLIEETFLNMPLIRPLYTGIKQLVSAFTLQDKITFQQVVMIEFPRKGVYSIGFLTSEFPSALTPEKEENLIIVYIPTTPNPTSGFCIALPKESVHLVDLTRQEAMTLIISGGIVKPERFK